MKHRLGYVFFMSTWLWFSAARAQGVDAVSGSTSSSVPVRLQVTPDGSTLHWSFMLENISGAPVEVVTDRRLLWFEILPSEMQPVGAARRVRRSRRVRCIHPYRPESLDTVSRTLLQPGDRYVEGFDVRELCGLRLPMSLVPGVSLLVHYGFAGRPSFARAVVLDRRTPPIVELVMSSPVVVPGSSERWPPLGPTAPAGDPRVRVTVSGVLDGATAMDVRPTVRIASTGLYPLRTFFRPGLIRLEVTTPSGDRVRCQSGAREYAPVRDFFVRLSRNGLAETLQLGAMCPEDALASPGIYRAQAVFESRVSGAPFGFTSFEGQAASPYFFVRIRRGRQPSPYRRQPVADPFAMSSPPG